MPVQLECEICKEQFSVPPCREDSARFCSRKCRSTWDSQKPKEKHPNYKGGPVTLVCEHCEEPFEVPPYRANSASYCSDQCHHSARSDDAKVKINCKQCGQEFEVKKSTKESGREHCSLTCANLSRGDRKTYECENCGEEFTRLISQASKRNFCSEECHGEWLSENISGKDHPRYKREAHNCDWCGSQFMCPPSRSYRRFCSMKCFGGWLSANNAGENNPRWKGGYEPYYGPNWREARRKARQRDNYTCQQCGLHEEEHARELCVHHIVPFRKFDDYEKANELSNLISVCPPCHKELEGNPKKARWLLESHEKV